MDKRLVASTVAEAVSILQTLPQDAPFAIYNDEAMGFTPVQISPPSPNDGVNKVIVQSSVVVTVEDYD